jgi:acetylornithine deacetylase/succinyl-diaminopimelate desuccinylase-like protein
VLPNAGHRLVRALATLWDDELRPVVAGSMPGAGRRRRTSWRSSVPGPLDARRHPRRLGDRAASTAAIDGTAAVHALTFSHDPQPPGLWSGHTDATPKTVTPAEAHARLDIRLVPDQDPRVVIDALRHHLDERGFRDIHMIVREAEPAWWTPPSNPVVQAAAAVSSEVAGMQASVGVAFPGTVPMYQVCAQHRVPATTLGAGRADCRATCARREHPDRRPRRRTKMMGRFMDAFARLPEVPRVP